MKVNETEFFILKENKADNFLFRPVDFDRDLATLYGWMHQPHIAPFWKLNLPLPEFKQWLRKSIATEHKDIYIGTMNGEQVCYLIAYSIENDPIREFYEYQNGDLGMHLLIGPKAYLNREDGLSIIRSMITFLFDQYKDTGRIVGEPDIRNRIVIPILKKLGGEVVSEINLHNKNASLIMGERGPVMDRILSDVRVEWLKSMNTHREEPVR
ncbi:GNAT family N-acetyltransferase [Rossellomorea arthrocnemi]|jgi:acetyl CoA:N6-hydroxylysine acetyl transferase|uniref:GNAT family N-acetyltransferase n=1 Tax=Rossellomorea arthrocnemi TaxID=2769542 RepID=UPI00191AA585|nr:GNAT family N-acetyltransferase [Rossellomorea arthrocnemi]